MNVHKQERIIYFDHAATSWPKAPGVTQAVFEMMEQNAGSPGRGSHRMGIQASRILFQCRQKISRLFHIADANQICFTLNTTMALNMALNGFLQAGDHVVTTSLEHNSVRRPLEHLRTTRGIEITYVPVSPTGQLDLEKLKSEIRANTTLIVVSHSSNLLGSIMPLQQIGEIAKHYQIRFMVDAAQSAGVIPIDVQAMNIDFLAFPGHKGLMGPQGTGGLYVNEEMLLAPLLHGGTGGKSEEIEQPLIRPDRYEAGTPNTPGIAGLAAGVTFILNEGIENIYNHEWNLIQYAMKQLVEIEDVHMLGPRLGEQRSGLVSFVVDGCSSSEIVFKLDRQYNIAVRGGLHCTPLAHSSAGTIDTGAVRLSVGYFNTQQEIDYFINAIREIITTSKR